MKPWLFALVLLTTGCQRSAPSGDEPAVTRARANKDRVSVDPRLLSSGRIKLMPVSARALSSELRVVGEVRSSESGSAEAGTLVSGRVASLEVAEGARVKRGQVLAWVDAPEVARATANLLLARARAVVAKHKRARQETLDAASATSKNALDDARAEDDAARAELLAARTLLTSLGGAEPPADSDVTALSARVPVRAPIAGIVAERNTLLGGAVSADKPLFRIVADSHASSSILARVPETVAAKPQAGTSATITPRGNAANSCQAAVEGSLGGIDVQTRTLAVRLAPDKGCAWLIPGSFVDVILAAESATPNLPLGLVVPRSALVDVRSKPTIFVAGSAPGEFEAAAVQVGSGDPQEVRIDSGLSAGQQIVIEGALLLKGELLRGELEGN
ncbi:MAG TPA: efflux RND transporter periplasmic adaptor subunit [Polyangiaceae bacterium]|nr:efflux RND transporter periplasmic adaptor subunit [Polyangiaceae bacterium]